MMNGKNTHTYREGEHMRTMHIQNNNIILINKIVNKKKKNEELNEQYAFMSNANGE